MMGGPGETREAIPGPTSAKLPGNVPDGDERCSVPHSRWSSSWGLRPRSRQTPRVWSASWGHGDSRTGRGPRRS